MYIVVSSFFDNYNVATFVKFVDILCPVVYSIKVVKNGQSLVSVNSNNVHMWITF